MKFGTQLSNLMNFYNTGQEKPNGIHVDHSEQHRFLFDIVEHAKHKQTYIQAFVFGFISQHILEQKIKPYLNHIKRDINCDFINTEALIDTLIMKKTYNVHTWKIPVYNEFNIGLLV